MKRKNIRIITSIALAAVLALFGTGLAFADSSEGADEPVTTAFGGWFGGQFPGSGGQSNGTTGNASEPSEIVTSSLTSNSAEKLTADTANAQTIVMSDSNNSVKISSSGTYIVTGTCSNGNLAVKKGTTGVVLILKDLDLTSTTGATLSLNKGTEVKVIIEGTVKLTDAEDLADEESDDFDGAAIKAKAGSSVVLTGTGTLTVNGQCKNGIKVSDLDADDKNDGYTEASFIIDGKDLTINVTADNDGMNSGTDLTIKSGNITVSAGDDGIHADYILTIGEEGSDGPTINIKKSEEGLEGATINIYSGTIDVTASDDGINAANSDLTGYTYSLNIMGGTISISAGADGIDSNGNVNITGGLTTIVKSASNGGEGGLDYDGTCYIKEGCFENPYGTTMDSGKGGMGGQGGRTNPWSQDGQTDPRGQGGQGGRTNPWGQDGSGGQNNPWGQGGQRPGTAPDGTSSPTPQDGEMPELPDGMTPPDGTMPQDGTMPELPDGMTPPDGSGFPGSQDGEMPTPPDSGNQQENNSGRGGSQPSGASEDSGETENLNWFQRLIRTIISWFTKDLNEQNF